MAEGSKHAEASLPQQRSQAGARRGKPNWTLRIGLALILIAADALFVGNKEKLLSKTRFASARALPMPDARLTTDEKALYWTYALYDARKFRARFRIGGGYVISRGHARHELEMLLPDVSPATMGEISGYGALAFQTVKARKNER